MKLAFDACKLKFRTACSAADPKLRDYTQWVCWRAPTERNKKNKGPKKRHTRTAARDARNALVQLWRASPSARSFAWTSRSARFSGPVPPPRTHPTGAALVASASGAAELAVPASRGGVPKSPSLDGGSLASRLEGVASPRPRPRSAAPEVPPAACPVHLQTTAEAAVERSHPA